MHAEPPFQSDHVLVQFLLDEFLTAYPLVQRLREEPAPSLLNQLVAEPKSRWSGKRGALTNLKRYTEGLAPTFTELRLAVSRAYCLATEALIIDEGLLTLIDDLLTYFAQITELVPHLIQSFTDNEHVLYFLLRHRSAFDAIYDPSFVKNLCAEMGSEVVRRFQERGFEEQIPDIESRLAELESVAI